MLEHPSGVLLPERAGVSPPAAKGLTVRLDALLWLALIAAGAALRLARLDTLPLTLDETARALDALRVSQGAVPEGWSGDMAAALTSYVFRLFDESDLAARVVPAVAGSLMVTALWAGSRGLGQLGALVTATLLALSPLAVLVSRSALPFGVGAFLAAGMAAALLSYLREPRALPAFVFAVCWGLALSADAVGVVAAAAAVVFLIVEPVVVRDSAVLGAWGVFRRSPAHWLSVLLVLAAAFELGFTRFGTSIELELSGIAQLREMLEGPRDARPQEFWALLLVGYEWPALVFGGGAVLAFASALRRGRAGLTAPQLFVLVWTGLAAGVLAMAAQREAGQLLVLALPLAFGAGLGVESLSAGVDWMALRRWWPVVAAALVLAAFGGLLVSEWSDPERGLGRPERLYLVLVAGGLVVLLVGAVVGLRRGAAAIVLPVAGVAALAFLLHSSFAVVRDDRGFELAVDVRTTDRLEPFRGTLEELIATRAGPVLIDPSLREPLAWYLRDLPVAFSPPAEDAGALVVLASREVDGFTELGRAWRIGEGWYPEEIDALLLWRWLVYREAYGNLEEVDVHVLVPTP